MRIHVVLIISFFALFAMACGGEESADSSSIAMLLTSTSAEMEQVQVTFTGVQLRYEGAQVQNRSQYRAPDPSGSMNLVQMQQDSGESGSNEAQGEWLRLQVQEQTQDMLQLQSGKTAEMGSDEVPAGFYNRLRFQLSKVQVKAEGATHDLALQAGEAFELAFKFQLQANKGQEMVIEFDAQKSIQKTQNGYEIQPVMSVKHFRYAHKAGGESGQGM